MRPRRLGADLPGADGEEHDRLPGLDRFLRGAREGPSVAEVLAVEGDHARRLVVDQAADELAGLEVGLVSERGEAREAEAVILGEQGELEREIAALGDEADRAALELVPAEVEAVAASKIPRQFGPRSTAPAARTRSTIAASRARPSSPVSPSPVVIPTSAFAPAASDASTASSKPSAGTERTTSSGASGRSASDG